MHHWVTLRPSELTSHEMLAQCRQRHAALQEPLRLLEMDWPQALSCVYCLADYLTDALCLDGLLLFDICLCNAIGTYNIAYQTTESERLWHFLDGLSWSAASVLTGIRLVDPEHFEWAAVDGVYLYNWLRRRPQRLDWLRRYTIQVVYTSSHTTTGRLQRVIRSRITTAAVSQLLEGHRHA